MEINLAALAEAEARLSSTAEQHDEDAVAVQKVQELHADELVNGLRFLHC